MPSIDMVPQTKSIMARILILFAHPAFEKSRTHARLMKHVRHLDGVTVNDLYQQYPDFDIDVVREQELLLKHDVILWQHPFYWYSAPALIKQWQDLVLTHGWAYGRKGKMLSGKLITNALSAGGTLDAYRPEGHNRFLIRELLAPFEQTARLCDMTYMPSFVVAGVHRLSLTDIELRARQYKQVLEGLRDDRFSLSEILDASYLNDLCPISQTLISG